MSVVCLLALCASALLQHHLDVVVVTWALHFHLLRALVTCPSFARRLVVVAHQLRVTSFILGLRLAVTLMSLSSLLLSSSSLLSSRGVRGRGEGKEWGGMAREDARGQGRTQEGVGGCERAREDARG